MQYVPLDFDKEQSVIDLSLRENKYSLDDRFVIKDGKNHPCAILVPGGGYEIVCSFVEGVPIAKKLNDLDISAFIVYYRIKNKAMYPNTMDDLAKGVKEIIDKKDKYNIDIENYSVWGCSAGGHLTAMFGLKNIGYKKYNLPKPGALVLAYPVISMDKEITHLGTHDYLLGKEANKDLESLTSVDKHVDCDYPKTYIWCSNDDKTVNYINTKNMIEALNKAGVTYNETIYHGVPHGSGPATGTSAEGWINKAVKFWLDK